jgi:DNA-binding beta-propeller fold protein YncE
LHNHRSWRRLSQRQGLRNGGRYANSTNLETARGVAVSPDETHVYVAASPLGVSDGTVAWFTRNGTIGALAYVDKHTSTNLDDAYEVTVSPDGAHVYAAATAADSVSWFRRY